MQIKLWSVGKAHDIYVKQGVDDFTKRAGIYFKCEWDIIPQLKDAGKMLINELKKKEGELILGKLQKEDFLVALEERGTQLTSEQLASFIQTRANAATKRIIFLIGGAYGLDEAVLQRSNMQWSLSKLVFPHQLVRLILAEQIYRACTIIKNEKYHHI